MTTKVLLIDDDVELAQMLTEYLEQDGFEVDAVHDGEHGLIEALTGNYMIAILDVMMPRMNGIETLRRIRKKSRMPIIMLTAKGDETDRIIGLELGADDYVPKPCAPRELTARIRAVLRRTQPAEYDEDSLQILEVGHLKMWPSQRRAEWDSSPLDLTSSEFNLLEVLVRHAGQPVSKHKLSEQGLGRELARFDRSIDMHMSNIRHKLGSLSDGRSSIQTLFGQGYQYIKD